MDQPVKKYPYYRMSTYEIYGSADYQVLCDMFLKYYVDKIGCCIAYAHPTRGMHRDDFVAIWLIGEEAMDPKTKEPPNSEQIGDILWRSDWPDELNNDLIIPPNQEAA